jgi:hypothetical protein
MESMAQSVWFWVLGESKKRDNKTLDEVSRTNQTRKVKDFAKCVSKTVKPSHPAATCWIIIGGVLVQGS